MSASTITTLPTANLDDALNAAAKWEQAVGAEIIGGSNRIHLFGLALGAREHMFLLGEPGVAKSMVVDRGVAYIIGVRYFKNQYHELSTPEEMYGPWSMKEMMEDRFVRVTGFRDEHGVWHEANWAQNCHIVLADEFYKGSVSLSNTALLMTNERQLNDNGLIIPVPLCSFLITANEERKSDEQHAFDDRIMLRETVDRPRDRADVIAMLRMPDPDPNPTPVIEWAQWEQIQAAVPHFPVTDEVYELVAELEHDLLTNGVNITPRRLRKCIRIIQAEALLEGADRAEKEHVAVLEHCTWLKAAEQSKAQQLVLTKAAPVMRDGLRLLADIEKVGVETDTLLDAATAAGDAANSDDVSKRLAEMKSLKRKLEKLSTEASSSRRARDLVARCAERQRAITMRLLVEGLDISPQNVQAMLADTAS